MFHLKLFVIVKIERQRYKSLYPMPKTN